jgi:hypothetical protein
MNHIELKQRSQQKKSHWVKTTDGDSKTANSKRQAEGSTPVEHTPKAKNNLARSSRIG